MGVLADHLHRALAQWCTAAVTEQTHLSPVSAVLVVALLVKMAQAMPPVRMLVAVAMLGLAAQAVLLVLATLLLALAATALNLGPFMAPVVVVALVATQHPTTMVERVVSTALAVAALRAAAVLVALASRA
jgi:hypothetical protein